MTVGISAVGGASNETLTAALTVLQSILLELDQKLEAGQLVGLEPADIAALQTVTATVVNWQTDYPDAGTQTRLDSVNTNLGTVNTSVGTVTTSLGTDGGGESPPNGTGVRGWLRAIYDTVKGTLTVSGTVTTSPPSHASTNIDQVAGTTIATNSGSTSAGTQRVVLATDQPQLTNALKVDGSAVTQPVQKTRGATPGRSAVSTSTVNATIVSANSNRLEVTIYNDALVTLYLKYGTTATPTDYDVALLSGGMLIEDVYTGRIDGILGSSTGTARRNEVTA